MWWERDVDARMERTRDRPLPAGRLSPDVALAFGLALGAGSLPPLLLVNWTATLLGFAALVSYVLVYTPLKPHTYLALLVGAVPGAMPPLMGWATVTGSVGVGGGLLFALLFLWQIPHFAAISVFRAEDYARAGLSVVSVQHGEGAARRMIVFWTALLVVCSMLFGPAGLAGRTYELVAALLGATFLALTLLGFHPSARLQTGRWARRVFAFSIVYLTVLLLVLVADKTLL
jgi:heme o synthase